MATYGLSIAYTLLLWWLSTGAILFLDGLNPRTFLWSLSGATILLVASIFGISGTSGTATESGAYEAFGCGLLAWGWQLVSFYMGYITGPRKTACEAGIRGWRHFVEAVRTVLYHELTVILLAAVLVVLTWGRPNQIGVWTYFVLWWMHQSAKLNIYFGVPNLGEELLPLHLRYLQSFMTRKPMNLFFPISVSLSTVLTVVIAQKAIAGPTPFEQVGFSMLATLMALAIAEHWFLVAPLQTNCLWQWGVKRLPNEAARDGENCRADPGSGDIDIAACGTRDRNRKSARTRVLPDRSNVTPAQMLQAPLALRRTQPEFGSKWKVPSQSRRRMLRGTLSPWWWKWVYKSMRTG